MEEGECPEVINWENLADIPFKGDKGNEKIPVPFFNLIPGFNFLELYLIGLGHFPSTNEFLCQQCIGWDGSLLGNKEKLILNNVFNNSTFIDRKDFFLYFLSQHIAKPNEDKGLYEAENLFYDTKEFFDALIKLTIDEKLAIIIEDFINLDNETNSYDTILNTLKYNDYLNTTYVFYSKGLLKQYGFPFLVLVHRKFNNEKLNEKKDSPIYQKIIEKLPKKMHKYYKLSLILGSSRGMPVMILISDDVLIKVFDGKTTSIPTDFDLSEHFDTVYLLIYNISGLDREITLKNTSSTSSRLSHPKFTKTDNLLREFIEYKYDFWKKEEFNLIDLIKKSLKYPAFFAYCSGYDLDVAFQGSVILETDDKSAEKLIDSAPEKVGQKLNSFRRMYGTFTVFILTFPKFIEELKSGNSDRTILKLNTLFSTVPAGNSIFFDLFVDFFLKLVKICPLDDVNKKINQYLYNIVENRDSLDSKETFYAINYNQAFTGETLIQEHKTPTMVVDFYNEMVKNYSDIFNDTNLLKIKYVPDYKPKYEINGNYAQYLSSYYYQPVISV